MYCRARISLKYFLDKEKNTLNVSVKTFLKHREYFDQRCVRGKGGGGGGS